MINNYTGTVIVGSPTLQTSVAGQEIIESPVFNFDILNDQDCHMSFNGGAYIFVRANQGFQIDVVSSCIIQETGITFNYIGVRR